MRLTAHAILRYQARIAPHLSFEDAKTELLSATHRAARLKEKTCTGQFLWRVDSPDMRLVTKKHQGEELLVTVLSPQMEIFSLTQIHDMLQEREEGLLRLQQVSDDPAPQPSMTYKERRGLLMLEMQILYHEQSSLKQREKLLRESTQNALRVAIQGLMGVLPVNEALTRLKRLSPELMTPDFYVSR